MEFTNPFLTHIRNCKTYIDDVLVIWRGSVSEAEQFLTWLNTQNDFLKFPQVISADTLVFLDLNITIEGDWLSTTTHTKNTARNCLLRFDSFHPKPMHENLLYGQYLRLRRNCSDVRDFKTQAKSLTEKFKARQYPERILHMACKRTRNNNRDALR